MMPGRAPPGILDREAEIAAIAAGVDAALSGSGTLLLVQGVAGIGKTRLLTHACELGARAGIRVLTARAAEFEAGFAWGVVRQLFVHGLYWLAAIMAQEAPLLLAVDDLHWADDPSQRFVAHLAHRLDGLPVLLVVTVREPASATAGARTPAEGLSDEPTAAILRPSALGAAACAELVRDRLGGQPAPAFQAACRELSGGNPLLLHALMASLIADGVRGIDADIPHLRRLTSSTVSRSVLLQLGRMPAAALAAARAVAVLGTAATTARAGRLAGLDAEECAEAITTLMAERLVEGERTLRFVHPLVRSAVYLDFAPPLRQQWHQRAARMLDAEGAGQEEVTVHVGRGHAAPGRGGRSRPWRAGHREGVP